MHRGGVNFIDSNPAIEGAQQANVVIGQNTANDLNSMQLSELMRTRDVEHAIDQHIRAQLNPAAGVPGAQPADLGAMSMGAQPAPTMQGQSMPRGTATPAAVPAAAPTSFAAPQVGAGAGPAGPGGAQVAPVPNAQPPADLSTMAMWDRPVSPARVNAGLDRVALAKSISGIDGGGAYAMQLLDQQQQQDAKTQADALARQDHAVTNYFAALGAGDTYSAKYWGDQAGMHTPDDVLHDADFQKFMGQAGKWKEFYGSDLQGFHDFTQAALKMHAAGDPDAFQKAYRVNPPTVKAAKGAYDDKNAEAQLLVKKFGYTMDQALTAVGLSKDGSGSGGGRGRGGHSGGVSQWKYDSYLKLHPGDEDGALAFSNGEKAVPWKDAYAMALDVLKLKQTVSGIDEEKAPIEDQAKALAVKIQQGDDRALEAAGAGGGAPATGAAPTDPFALSQDAYDAIAQGADPQAVKDRYKQQTGQDLPPQGQ